MSKIMAQQNLDELIAALTTLTTALTKIKATDMEEDNDYVKLPPVEQETRDFLDEGFGGTDQYPHLDRFSNCQRKPNPTCEVAWPYRIKHFDWWSVPRGQASAELTKFLNEETKTGDEFITFSGSVFIFKSRTTKR